MFDVGFSEMLVIGIVALVVIGPERLPKVARTLGHLMGRAQRYVNDVKRDIDREMQIEELRKLQTEMQDAARSIESSVTTQVSEVKTELDRAQDGLNALASQADLTRLDDPAAAATEAGMDSGSATDQSVLEAPAAVQTPTEVTQQQAAQEPTQEPKQETAQQPTQEPKQEAAQQPTQEAAQSSAQPAAQAESAEEADLSWRHLDHIEPDYSEGAMAPNPPPASAGSGSPGGSSAAAGSAARNVLVHVDVPPVT